MPSIKRRSSFRIGPWRVEPDENMLSREDLHSPLLPRSMEVLVYLAERNNVVIPAEELIAALWGERFFGENPLYKHVALLRQALKVPGKDIKFIKTVPKKGYSLIADVAFPDDYKNSQSQPSVNWSKGSPFRGLQAFDVEHSDIFFGRDRMTNQVVQALKNNAISGTSFVLLLGASGSGKSSLVRAGVTPFLSQSMVLPEVSKWFFAGFRPSDSPKDLLRGLAVAIASSGFVGSSNESSIDQLALRLATAPEDVSSLLINFQNEEELATKKLVLFVDQLEEIFVLEGISKAQREVFLSAIQVFAHLGYIWVIAAMRNDYYPRCSELEALVELKRGHGQVDIEAPTSSEIGQMIRLPARAANLNFEEESDSNLRLDDLLRDEAINQPESLPLLEFALDALYEQRTADRLLTIEAYQQLGGLSGALARRAEETYESLGQTSRASAQRVFGALVDIDAVTGQRTKIPLEWNSGNSAVDELISRFIDNRLIIGSLDKKGQRIVSLAHEALIRHWPRLKGWLDENDELLRIRSRVRNAAQRWSDEARVKDLLLPAGRRLQDAIDLSKAEHIELSPLMSEYVLSSQKVARRNQRFFRASAAAVACSAIIAVIAAMFAMTARDDALEQKTQAEGLLGFMVGDLQNKLVSVGRLDILETVSDKAMDYFSSQDIGELSDSALINHAKTLEQIGQVRLGQGSMRDALAAFEVALQNSQEIVDRDNSNLDAQFALGNAHYWVGFVHWKLSHLDLTQQHWESYYDIANSLVAAEPSSTDWQLELSYALNNLGTIALELDQFDSALAYFTRSIDVKEELVAQDSANTGYQTELADSLSWLASTLESQGQLNKAEKHYLRVLELAKLTLSANPADATSRYRLGLAHRHVSNVSEMRGKTELAFTHNEAADSINDQLLELDNSNSRWHRDRVYLQLRKAQLLLSLKQLNLAEPYFDQAIEGIDRLIEQDSVNRTWQELRAYIYVSYTQFLLETDRAVSTENYIDQAILSLEAELEASPQSNVTRRWLARAYLLNHQLIAINVKDKKQANLLRLENLISSFPDPLTNPQLIAITVDFYQIIGKERESVQMAKSLYARGYRENQFTQSCRRLGECLSDQAE